MPNRPDTKFNLGSVNKMVNGVAIAQLIADRRLSFEPRLEDVLPDYPNQTVATKIIIQRLLGHMSGLGMFFESPGTIRGRNTANTLNFSEVSPITCRCLNQAPG